MDVNTLIRISAAIGEVLKAKEQVGTIMGIISTIEACKEGQCKSPVYDRYVIRNSKNVKNIILENEIDEISYVAGLASRYSGDLFEIFSSYAETENDIKQLSRLYMLIRLYIR
jgi:hypothetical protein